MVFELSLKLMNFDLRDIDSLELIASLLLGRRNEGVGFLEIHLKFIYQFSYKLTLKIFWEKIVFCGNSVG